MKEREEIRDGKVYVVKTLPSDRRLQPNEVRRRALWNRLTSAQKKAHIEKRKAQAAKKRRRGASA